MLVADTTNNVCRCSNPSDVLLMAGRMRCVALKGCPLKMYLNETMGMCLSCDFGCVTCEQNNDITVCTSCYPGYILFLAPLPACRLDSSLLDCSGDMSLE